MLSSGIPQATASTCDEALEARRKGHRVKEELYAEIDLRMYTLPTSDMVTEYKYLAQIYLDYEFSLEPSEIKVRGFVELRCAARRRAPR